MPLCTCTPGSLPGCTVASHRASTPGRVLRSRAERCRRLTSSTAGSVATVISFASTYDTGNVMTTNSTSVDKAAGAGRPRDPRIDGAILRATADLLVEIGYSNLTMRSEEHTSELQSRENLVCRLLLEKK